MPAHTDFELVQDQAVELHERWLTYRRLFGERSRREFLNRSSPALFSLLAELFREGILSSLFRMTDKETTGGKEHVTIRLIPPLCPRIEQDLQNQVDELTQRVQPLKTLRHQLVGHTDRLQARQTGVLAVPEFDEGKVEDILSRVRQIVDSARAELAGRASDFDYELETVDGVDFLIAALGTAGSTGGS